MPDDSGAVGAIKELLSWVAVPALWLSSRTNRQRLAGARVEAVSVLMRRTPNLSVLLVRSVYDKCWMLPQEGVLLGESVYSAVERGLWEECGLKVGSAGQVAPDIQRRDQRYVGRLELPKERWGERAVVGNAGDGPMSQIVMKQKAYWVVFLVAGDDAALDSPVANKTEVEEVRWCDFDEAAQLIRTNRPAKAALSMRILRLGMQHMVGARASKAWQTI